MSTALANGWLGLYISEIANFGSGDLISVAQLSEQSEAYPIPVFGGNGIAGYTSSATVSEPTVILGRVGQKCGAVYRNSGPAWITDNALYARRFKRPVDVQFFAYALEAARLNDVRNHNDLPLITQSILNDVKIAWPESLREQRHIAEALSDADGIITTLERLLAKKRAIKQGVMQSMLTGTIRLPKYAEPWRELTLGDLGRTYGGLSGKSASDFGSGNSKFITFVDVMANVRVDRTNLAAVRIDAYERQNSVAVGDVLFNGSSETPEDLALASVVVSTEPRTYLNSFCFGFRPRSTESIDSQFLAYLFRGAPGRRLLQALAQGSTRYNLSKSQFRRLSIRMPGVDEQAAISRILVEMDDEMDRLDQRLVKAHAVRQGMLYELLTGRVRMPLKEIAA